MERETVLYNGKSYHRYPESTRPQLRKYYYRHDKNNASPVALHRQIYEDVHGPIPKGAQIHHKDHNHSNNSIENLKCLSVGEHRKEHPMSEEARKRASERSKGNTYVKDWIRQNPDTATKHYAGKADQLVTSLEKWKKENPF